MSLPDQTSKLPKLPFLIGDVVLLATAWFIANRGPGPLTADAIAAIFGCVAVGAVLLAVPFISEYARKQEELLDERQRGLDALSQTINTAAEQISIAANGLHQITEITHKNLKHAEQLPQRLQEKISEFNAQVENAREDEREELEKEIAELRASESERLETIAGRIQQATAELTKLEAAVQKQIAARAGAVEQSETALAKAHREIAGKLEKALADLDAKLAERAAAVIAAIESAAAQAATSIAAAPAAAPLANGPEAVESAPPPVETTGAPEVAVPPKRPRKSRREEPATADASPSAAPNEIETPAPTPAPVETPAAVEAPAEPVAAAAEPAAAVEPPPVPADEMVKIEPVAPRSAIPFSVEPAAASEPPPAPAPAEAAPAEPVVATVPESTAAVEAAPVERAARKRPSRKPAAAPADEGELELASPPMDDAPVTQADAVERVISSDGATRLIATAYIGIGNRLFIRGEGPGLSWEKGIPLQFVSIGKWRWETVDAVAPITFKLLKNDEVECAALGTLTLEPGHQQEVTAKF